MSAFANIVLGGVFHAAVLFLVAAGLQLVFGVQKILNLACGSFYALGAYFGITFAGFAIASGMPAWALLPALVLAGLMVGLVGLPIERMLRTVYGRDESFQLLLTFALLLMFQDVFRFFWGANPRSIEANYLVYGKLAGGDFAVFTAGTMLGTVAGALVVPTAAASLDMAVELVVEAFAVVVIGGLGSMPGALAGAVVVGLIHAYAIYAYPELELLATYLIVIGVLLLRPAGLFGRPAT
jgi:branched-chain amino acid transport system permease protein